MAKKLNFLPIVLVLVLITFCFLAHGIEAHETGPDDNKMEGSNPEGPGHKDTDNKMSGPSPKGPGHADTEDKKETNGGYRKEKLGYAAFSLIILTVSKCMQVLEF